jgi:hypothetical protein
VTGARTRVSQPVLQELQLLMPADEQILWRQHTGSIAARESPVQVQYPVQYQH